MGRLKQALLSLAESKIRQKMMAEDLVRESGYMLQQSHNVQDFLQDLIYNDQTEDFSKAAVERLLIILKQNNIENKENEKMDQNKTLKNLMEAFAGESQANRKYLAYSKKAEKDGKINAAKLFKAASDAETLHALKHFEVAKKVGSTSDNLSDAVSGETHEYMHMYPDFVKTAKEEGNKAALISFTYAMKAEEVHAKLYKEALESLDETEEVFYYLCPVCGNIEKFRPDNCSICGALGTKFIEY